MPSTDPWFPFKQNGTSQPSRTRTVLAPTSPTPAQALVLGPSNGPNSGANTYPEVDIAFNYIETGTVAEIRLTILGNQPPLGSAIIVDVESSVDGGTTWASIWGGDVSQMAQLQPGQFQSATRVGGGGSLTPDTWLRANVKQIGSTQAGADLEMAVLAFFDT